MLAFEGSRVCGGENVAGRSSGSKASCGDYCWASTADDELSGGITGKMGTRSGDGIQVAMECNGEQEAGAERLVKGKTVSTNLTCLEIYILEVDGSRQ